MAVRDKIAGKVVADRDKTAGEAEAIHDKIAEGIAELLVDPSTEAILEAEERIGEEANEIIVIDSITETIIDKIAGRVVAGGDKIAEEVTELLAEQPIGATLDNTVDTFVELAILEAAELAVDPSIEAIQAAERIDKEAEGPRFESKLH